LVSGGTVGGIAENLINKGFRRFVGPRIRREVDRRVPGFINQFL